LNCYGKTDVGVWLTDFHLNLYYIIWLLNSSSIFNANNEQKGCVIIHEWFSQCCLLANQTMSDLLMELWR